MRRRGSRGRLLGAGGQERVVGRRGSVGEVQKQEVAVQHSR